MNTQLINKTNCQTEQEREFHRPPRWNVLLLERKRFILWLTHIRYISIPKHKYKTQEHSLAPVTPPVLTVAHLNPNLQTLFQSFWRNTNQTPWLPSLAFLLASHINPVYSFLLLLLLDKLQFLAECRETDKCSRRFGAAPAWRSQSHSPFSATANCNTARNSATYAAITFLHHNVAIGCKLGIFHKYMSYWNTHIFIKPQ